jgi:ribulose-phosphate 3-epimerase
MSKPVVQDLRDACPAVSVGVVTADLLNLGSEIALLEDVGVPLVHFDIMDGCWCPMTTVGPPLVKAVKTRLLKDVHLMIENPLDKLEAYVAAGADIVTVHSEGCDQVGRVLQKIGGMTNANDPSRGIARGIALNPGTPVTVLEAVLQDVDLVLLLAVEPGLSGQSFAPATAERAGQVREMIVASGFDIMLGIDGGVKAANIKEIAGMGADIIVTGSAVFDGKAPRENAAFMLSAVRDVCEADSTPRVLTS